MADQKIHLRKEVISNLSALELYEGSFDEVIISEEIYIWRLILSNSQIWKRFS